MSSSPGPLDAACSRAAPPSGSVAARPLAAPERGGRGACSGTRPSSPRSARRSRTRAHLATGWSASATGHPLALSARRGATGTRQVTGLVAGVEGKGRLSACAAQERQGLAQEGIAYEGEGDLAFRDSDLQGRPGLPRWMSRVQVPSAAPDPTQQDQSVERVLGGSECPVQSWERPGTGRFRSTVPWAEGCAERTPSSASEGVRQSLASASRSEAHGAASRWTRCFRSSAMECGAQTRGLM